MGAINSLATKTLDKANGIQSYDDIFEQACEFLKQDPRYAAKMDDFLQSELASQLKTLKPEEALSKGVPLMYEQVNKAKGKKGSLGFFQ